MWRILDEYLFCYPDITGFGNVTHWAKTSFVVDLSYYLSKYYFTGMTTVKILLCTCFNWLWQKTTKNWLQDKLNAQSMFEIIITTNGAELLFSLP